MSILVKLVISIISVVGMWGWYYLTLPTLSIAHFGGFFFFGVCAFVVAINIAIWLHETEAETIGFGLAGLVAIIWFIICIGGGFIGGSIFNANTWQQQLGQVEEVSFEDMIKQIDTSQIPIVDEELAEKQADKKIGEDIALGSRVKLGDAAIQNVNGEIMFVAPLEHAGFYEWKSNRSTPGYITVSASNPNKVEFITELEGEKIDILYQQSAYFGNNLKRKIRKEGFKTVGLTEYTFEIDDTGRPYWVVTTYENRTLWGAPEATGVVIVDAQNGETEWYSVDKAPDWVDVIQPKDFVETQIDNWGEYIHGFWNTVTAKKDMIKKTDLTLTVYVNGDCYYFTGMTSVGSDQSCVGFIMVNTRSKKAQISYMSGATEEAAMKSAEGLVSDYGYKSTEPLPVNINGLPTYIMALKDDEEGLIQRYAMVNVNNYNLSAYAKNLEGTKRAYLQKVAENSSTSVVGSDEAYGYTYEGIVQRISSVVEEGSTYYYMVVEGEKDKIFMASYMVSEELSVTRDGDTVRITYVDDKNGTVDIISFDNIAFATQISKQQEKRDEFDEGTSAYDDEYNQIIEVNPEMNQETWDALTEEEKAKIIENYLNAE